MKRFNWPIWAAFLLSVVTYLSWFFVFVKWPATRDFPWVNLLLLGASMAFLSIGIRRGWAPGPHHFLRVIVTLALTAMSLIVLVSFLQVVFVAARALPASEGAPQVGQKAPDFSLADESGKTVSLSSLLAEPGKKGVLLIFYMYSGCRACNSEFRGVQKNLGRFTELGVRPVAISVDEPATSRQLSQEAGYTFTFLSDPKLDVIRRYDLVHNDQEARPAEFLLDSTGIVRWRNLTSNYYVRARPEQMLEAAKSLR